MFYLERYCNSSSLDSARKYAGRGGKKAANFCESLR